LVGGPVLVEGQDLGFTLNPAVYILWIKTIVLYNKLGDAKAQYFVTKLVSATLPCATAAQ